MEATIKRGYFAVGLDNPKTPANVGAALRAVGVYDGAMMAVSGTRYSKAITNMQLSRIPTDTMKAYRHLPMLRATDLRDVLPYNCVPVAIEIVDGAVPLSTYKHPERAFYIFGAEDATLGRRILGWCRDVVYIPTNGCMNLAATVNVVLYDRQAKQIQHGRNNGSD